MVEQSAVRDVDAHENAEGLAVQLCIAPQIASLRLSPSQIGGADNAAPLGLLELPIDEARGFDDLNLRILQAMQVAALTEIGRQLRKGRGQGVHIPKPLDLADLGRFPGGRRPQRLETGTGRVDQDGGDREPEDDRAGLGRRSL